MSLWIVLLLLCSPSSSTTHICSNDGECEGQRLICSSREACYVECTRNWSCRRTTIECPINQECHIKCHYDGELDIATNGQYICQHMVIEATDSSLLIINASIGYQPTFPYPRTLESAVIHCPHNNNKDDTNIVDKPCRIYCDGDDLMRGTTIMAMQGMNGVHIESTHYSKSWCIRNTELKCNEDYSISCSLTNQPPFDCRDINSDVANQQCQIVAVQPTPSPIFRSESMSPSNRPTSTPIIYTETATPTQTPNAKTPSANDEQKIDEEEETDERKTNSGLLAGIMIPLFILSVLGMCCGIYIMQKRGTWFTKEEMRNRESGQKGQRRRHQRVNTDDDDDHDDHDDAQSDDAQSNDEEDGYNMKKKQQHEVNGADERKEDYDIYSPTPRNRKTTNNSQGTGGNNSDSMPWYEEENLDHPKII